MSEETAIKPFSMGYVLRATAKHMRKSINISIRKTFERIKDFEENSPESREIFYTLSQLHTMLKQLDDFQEANKENFKERKG
jgi:hypothetical protein